MPAPCHLDGAELINDNERARRPAPQAVRPEVELACGLRIKTIGGLEGRITDGIRKTPGVLQHFKIIPRRAAPFLRPFTGKCHETVRRPPLEAPPVSEAAQERGLSRADRSEYSDE
jgi:hypothetical protein